MVYIKMLSKIQPSAGGAYVFHLVAYLELGSAVKKSQLARNSQFDFTRRFIQVVVSNQDEYEQHTVSHSCIARNRVHDTHFRIIVVRPSACHYGTTHRTAVWACA
jgi:hypothetical protein